MHLTRLRLYQYRNIQDLEIDPSEGTTLFVGKNGQGKTNILEAINFLAFGRSFRTAIPAECIQHGKKECRIEGTVHHGSLVRKLEVSILRNEKKLYLHGKQAALDVFVGNLHILAFTYDHLNIVRKSPGDRRAFLDRGMATIYPGHIHSLAMYSRALKQRNRTLAGLRDKKENVDEKLLDSWDETLVKHGTRILVNRFRYVDEMKQVLPQSLFGSEQLKMHYVSTINDIGKETEEIEKNFRKQLLDARETDQRIGHTSLGPHRDDLKLYVDGKSLVDYGSAGQQRSSLLTLYFSQMEIHRKVHGFYPVFLVDDAEAELDEQRLNVFLDYLTERTQTFLASVKNFPIPAVAGGVCSLEVNNGTVRRIENL